MVDILIDGITTLEFINSRVRVVVVTKYHWHGETILVNHHIALCIASHRSIWTAHAWHFLWRILGVLINALVAEAIDTTEWVVQLNAGEVATIVLVEFAVQALQNGFVHLHDFVLVVGKAQVTTDGELACLHDFASIEVHFPTIVAHTSVVLNAEVCET